MLEAHLPRQTESGEAALTAPQPSVQADAEPGPPPLPAREWFAVLNDERAGPFSLQDICRRISRRELGAEDLVWRRGLGHWQPVVAVEELRHVLNEAPSDADDLEPPPLPPRGSEGSRGQLLQLTPRQAAPASPEPGTAVAALALATDRPPLQSAARPVLAIIAAPQPAQARWPLWVALLGGLMMLGSAGVLLLRRSGSGEVDERSVLPRAEQASPASYVRIEPEQNPASEPTREFPALEVRHSRQAARGAREELPDHRPDLPARWSSEGMAARLGTKPDDVKTTLAMRIYRKNRSSLAACDALAGKRGEVLSSGSRAEFQIKVSASGAIEVAVNASGLSRPLLSCYRAVPQQWRVPATGAAYSTSFEHVHQ